MDVLSEVFAAVRVSGGVFLDAEFTAPWCVVSQVGPEDFAAQGHLPAHLIAYHYVIDGRLLVRVGNDAPLPVLAGEIVLPKIRFVAVGQPARKLQGAAMVAGGHLQRKGQQPHHQAFGGFGRMQGQGQGMVGVQGAIHVGDLQGGLVDGGLDGHQRASEPGARNRVFTESM